MNRKVMIDRSMWLDAGGDWEIGDARAILRVNDQHDGGMNNRLLLLPGDYRDGEISAEVAVPANSPGFNAGLVFRYRDKNAFYAAGIGFYEMRSVIHIQGSLGSNALKGSGLSTELRRDRTYQLKAAFKRDRFELFLDGVSECVVADAKYPSGQVGLKVNGFNGATFSNVHLVIDDPELDELVALLKRFPFCFKREGKPPQDEKDIQRVLWTILRARYDDLDEEETLDKYGVKHYRNDFGIPRLDTIVEAKYLRPNASQKDLQEELMVDVVGYFNTPGARYKNIVFLVYNASGKALDPAMARALESTPHVLRLIEVTG